MLSDKIAGIFAKAGLVLALCGLALSVGGLLIGTLTRLGMGMPDPALESLVTIGGVMTAAGGFSWAAYRPAHFCSSLDYGEKFLPGLKLFSGLLGAALSIGFCCVLVIYAPDEFVTGHVIAQEPHLNNALMILGGALLALTLLFLALPQFQAAWRRAPLATAAAIALLVFCLFLPVLFSSIVEGSGEAVVPALFLGSLLLLLLLRVPVGMAAAFAVFSTLFAAASPQAGMSLVRNAGVNISSYGFMAVLLAVVMGQLAIQSGIALDVIRMVRTWLGRLPGGEYAAAACGASVYAGYGADALASSLSGERELFARVMDDEADPAQKKRRMFSLFAAICSGRALGLLLFPCAALLMAAISANISMARLSLSAVSYGNWLLLAVYILLVLLSLAGLTGRLAARPYGIGAKLLSLFPPKTMDFFVLGVLMYFILTGLMTPTEAFAFGVPLMFLHVALYGRVNARMLQRAFGNSVSICGGIALLWFGAHLYGYFLAMTGISGVVAKYFASLQAPGSLALPVVLLGCGLIYALLGSFLRVMPAVALTMPLLLPLFMAMGTDYQACVIMLLLLAAAGRSGSLMRELRGQLAEYFPAGRGLAPGFWAITAFQSGLVLLTVLTLLLFMPSGFNI